MIKLDLYKDEYSAKDAQAPYGISAGGVVYRKIGDTIEYLILGRKTESETSYHLPKGTLHLDETLEACALREIREEAGVNTELKTYIGGKHAIFDFKGKANDKVFVYYVAEYLSDAEEMDDEHDFRVWCSYEDAIAKLSTNIKQENEFIERAAKYLMRSK